jgi:hypothetical protein
MNEPIHIGNQKQLFLDSFLIEWCDKVRRRVCPVTKRPENPVIRPVADWEPSGYIVYGSVLYDEEEEIYKAWCFGLGDARTSRQSREVISGGVYYFTSKDGIHWARPELDVVTLEGRPTNVVVLASHSQHEKRWPGFYELFGVSKNQSDPDPSRRYKMGYLYLIRDYHGPGEAQFHSGQRRGLGVAFSPDGIHWTPMDDAVTQATCDGATHWFYDEKRGCYILYGRTKHIAPEVRARYGEDRLFQRSHWGRAVNRAESEDFVHWMPDEGELVLAVDVLDGPGDEIYSMSVFPYEGIYIGLVQMFHNYYDSVYLDVQLAVSRDSVHFERLSDRSPFIPVGGVGTWDRFNNSLANNPPIRVGDELRFYYGGRNYLHSGLYKGPDGGPATGGFRAGVGLGTIKLDRFAAMEATFDPGTLRTKPIVFEGKRLHLNANVKFGSIEVTLLNVAGNLIEGMHALIYGQDSVDIQVPMEIGKLSGEPKRLEFTIRNAQLYSFWVD